MHIAYLPTTIVLAANVEFRMRLVAIRYDDIAGPLILHHQAVFRFSQAQGDQQA